MRIQNSDDRRDRYVLGGRVHKPSQDENNFQMFVTGCFSVLYRKGITEDEAVQHADRVLEKCFESAKSGEEIVATLRYKNRVVKHYPRQVK